MGCDCGDIVWDICFECEWEFTHTEAEEDECSCKEDEKDIHCRSCYGGGY
jgi:hypothetical protein